jgi:type I restriction-modification system DNA methylase subunit
MASKDIYKELDYIDLVDVNKASVSIDLEEFRLLGIDKVYFSGDFPAIFFKEIIQFDKSSLREIARIQHLIWNYRKVMFLFVSSPHEVRIYNCSKKPFYYDAPSVQIAREVKKLEIVSETRDALQIVKEIFSRTAVDSGVLWTTDNKLRLKIDIQHRLDRYLVSSLLKTAKELKNLGLDEEIIHCLLMRSIFIMYLEDKGAAKETNLYSEIKENANSYFDILEDKTATYKLFRKVEDHFNGNVFPLIKNEEKKVTDTHLDIIKKCLIDGDISDVPRLFGPWRLFRFEIIQIEFLSEIYENFLTEFKGKKKGETGQYYTPPSLVELILNEKLKFKNEINWNFKILDPACGSGIFLVESFKRLIQRWKNAHPNTQIEFKNLVKILENNIFGIELDKFSLRVTAFSLYLAIVEQLNPKTLWIDKSRKFPFLIKDDFDKSLERQGNNLFRADTIGDISTDNFTKVDLVIGNPPFGANIKQKSIKRFCEEHKFGQDLVIPFLRKSVDFTKKGTVALIFNTKVLTNTEGPFQNFRKWLFKENFVEKIYNFSIFRKPPKSFGGQLFTSAVGPVSIIFYQKNSPTNPVSTLEYWAPRTYVKNNLVEGVVIDSTEIKFLPRNECEKSDSKIWKIAMWGSMEDFILIEKFKQNFSNLKFYLNKFGIKNGVGFQLLTNKNDKPIKDEKLANLKYLDADNIEPYFTPVTHLSKINSSIKSAKAIEFYINYYKKKSLTELPKIEVFRRLGTKKAYESPHFVIKKGLKDGQTCACYLDYNCSFRDGVYGFYGSADKKNILKTVAVYFNSQISNYYLFLSISSYGIERDQIMKNEYLEIPFFPLEPNEIDNIVCQCDKLINNKKNNVLQSTSLLRENIEEVFIKKMNISTYEKYFIEDVIKFNVDLFHNGMNSIALKNIDLKETKKYARILCKFVEDYLDSNVKLNAKVYDIAKNFPLNLVVLKFSKVSEQVLEGESNEIKSLLKYLDNVTFSREAKSIYIKRNIKYYEGDTIYIIKPNQKRFWSRSSAIIDAKELIGDILKM